MILQDLINTFEKLKQNIYLIERGDTPSLLIKFDDSNFFHLVGLHKTNIDLFMPAGIKSKAKKYKYLKGHLKRFNKILLSEIEDNELLEYRVKTFNNILDLLDGEKISLYDLSKKIPGSIYKGNFGILKIYQNIYCLLALIINTQESNIIKCAPQSWMASNRINYLIRTRKQIYIEKITKIPIELYNEKDNLISV